VTTDLREENKEGEASAAVMTGFEKERTSEAAHEI
jgi:hypothetical protein